MRREFGKLLVGFGLVALAAPAFADRGPSKEEAQAISVTLTAEGFKSWNKVEYDPDGGIWKVDDARKISGKTYDVQLNRNFQVIKKDGD